MPSTKPTRARKTVPEKTVRKKSVAEKRPVRLTGAIGAKTIAIVALLVIAGGILVAARQQSSPRLAMTPRQDMVSMPEARVTSVPGLPPTNATSEAAASAPKAAAPVTITGCLERDGDGFRLKDTAGVSAPRSRNWKSGFLKKGSGTVDVVDAAHGLRLADQIGRRVSVTGALVDRSMSARSLRRVASSCDK